MNSVDRATLIDFALGRLDDAEAAALANRAERDSEFAQTLAALRRELASLDAVCPSASALRALPLRSPLFDAVETTFPPQTPLASDDDAQNVVIFDAPAPNAVKVRRVGPAYPFYGDEDGPKSQDEQFSENKQDAQISRDKQSSKDAQNSQNQQGNKDRQNDLNKQINQGRQDEQTGEGVPNSQDGQLSENKQDAQNNRDKQASEDSSNCQDKQDVENKQNTLNEQINQGKQDEQTGESVPNSQDKQLSENKQDSPSKQLGENGETALLPTTQARPLRRRFNFIPKFIAAPRAPQGSAFVAKRARFLDDAQEDAPRSDEFQNVASLDQEAARENERDTAEQKTDYRDNAEQNVADFEISNEERSDATQNAQVGEAITPNVETASFNAQETPNDKEAARENERETSEQKTDYRDDAEQNVADFEISNEERSDATQNAQVGEAFLQNAENAFANAERRLVELLGREPTPTERDEYYWEPIDEEFEEVNAEFQSKKRRSLLGAPTRFATETTIAIGRATLALCGFERRAALGSDAFAATKARRKRQPGRISDMMISTVSGLLIAVVVVWPLLCLAAKEVLATIALSAVRKIGVNVQISESAPQQDVLPLITEYIVFPRSSESAALQSLDAAPPQETGARFETPTLDDVPVVKPAAVPAVDPASTPPTLVPAPADPAEAYNAPLDDAEKSPSEAPFLLNDV